MSVTDQAFYNQDYVRVMASISLHLTTALNANVADHQAALTAAEDHIQALIDAGFTPPADLESKTDAQIQKLRDGHQASIDKVTELLDLPGAVSESMNLSSEQLLEIKQSGQQWVLSIDAAWTPGGGN